MQLDTKKITIIAMFCAIAYVIVVFVRIPVVLFLKYEPKDVIITIGAFMMGPFTGFLISLIVSLVEMITVSDTGPIGLLMNVISTCAFTCTAAFIYKKKHNMKGAVLGLFTGTVLMTASMLLWNYLITPLYLNIPRPAVVALLIPAILPFNLLKAGINMALTILLYKPIVTALRKANLLPPSQSGVKKGKINLGFMIFALVLLITCVLLVLAMRGII
ncbi:MAG: ECF transporter S component [Clostridiales bacterium]|nr:ECF transporter S component [Clostridiales bacterium]